MLVNPSIITTLTPATLSDYLDTWYGRLEPLLKQYHNCLIHGFPKLPLQVSRANLQRVAMVSQVCCSQDGGQVTGMSIRDIIKVPAGIRCDVFFFGGSTQICLDHVFYQLKPLITYNCPHIILTVRIPMQMLDMADHIDKAFGDRIISSKETWVIISRL